MGISSGTWSIALSSQVRCTTFDCYRHYYCEIECTKFESTQEIL